MRGTGGFRSSGVGKDEWRTFLTIEDRQSVREKIRAAYLAHCKTFDELLDACVAIDEELLHIAAPSRLDYFKSSFDYDARVQLKRRQLSGRQQGASAPSASHDSDGSSPSAAKKPKL
jgi:hypothetical protein